MSDYLYGGKPPVAGSSDERMWAMLCHLSTFASFIGIPFGNILGPLIVWLIKKDEYPLVDDQGKEALNFQISMTIYTFVGIILIITIPLVIGLLIFDIVVTILAALRANAGERYRYPMTIRFIA